MSKYEIKGLPASQYVENVILLQECIEPKDEKLIAFLKLVKKGFEFYEKEAQDE